MEQVKLKRGKETIFQDKHHWIFSGALEENKTELEDGTLVEVVDHAGNRLGEAMYNPRQSLALRILSFDQLSAIETIRKQILRCIMSRKQFIDQQVTNCFRLVNGEGDLIPSLIIDQYGDALVLQSGTKGMDRLMKEVVAILQELNFKYIYEKSDSQARQVEKLEKVTRFWGREVLQVGELVEVRENGIKFLVDFFKGQKTGLFLDQREMRELVGRLSRNKRVLNCFAYQGGFSLYALRGGAVSVDSVDISNEAIKRIEKNLQLNNFEQSLHRGLSQDAFEFLRTMKPHDYDFIILDPPAFQKKKNDAVKAFKAYKDINRLALKSLPPGGILLTCSCSYFMDEKRFQTMLFQAAKEAKREVVIKSRHIQALDHSINLNHPESSYLKSFLVEVF